MSVASAATTVGPTAGSAGPAVSTPPTPLRVGPVPGESLDSYVHWLARQLHSSPVGITAHLGLSTPTSAGYLNRDVATPDLAHAAARLGLPASQLSDTTLQRWGWLGLHPERGKRGSPLGAWQRGSGARYCPECLHANGGRWPLAWYLHWTFACLEHSRLLASRCPACTKPPRSQKPGAYPLRPADRMALNCGCTARATHEQTAGRSPDTRLSPDDPRLIAQTSINYVLASTAAEPAETVTAGHPTTAHEWLTDLTLVTHFVMLSLRLEQRADAFTASAASYDLDHLRAPSHWRSELRRNDPPASSPMERAGAVRPPSPQILLRLLANSAADVAACVTLADALLRSDDIEHLRTGLLWVPNTWRVQTQQRAGRGQFAASEALMEAIAGRVRKTTDTWYTSLRVKYRPQARLGGDFVRYFPASLHPTLRQHLRTVRGELKEAAVVAGLLAGRRDARLARDTARRLQLAHLAPEIASTWMQLSADHTARAEIKLIASWLFTTTYQFEPIDFEARRQHLPHPQPLPRGILRSLARHLATRNSPTLRLMSEMYVWERVTGCDALLTPTALHTYGAFRVRYRRLRERWGQCLPVPLHHHLTSLTAELDGLTRPAPPTTEGPHGADIRPLSIRHPTQAPVDPRLHWTSTSHTEPHLLRTSLAIRPHDHLAKDLTGADAVILARAIAARPEAAEWAGVRLMWRYDRDIDDTPAEWLNLARDNLRTLTGHPDPDRQLHDVLTYLRTAEVPHRCPYRDLARDLAMPGAGPSNQGRLGFVADMRAAGRRL